MKRLISIILALSLGASMFTGVAAADTAKTGVKHANAEYELTAPGVGIHSTLPGNRYAEWDGTSMAAPFVSAAAAIIRSHYSDKAMYSSRFVMGQLVSATTDRTSYVSIEGRVYEYPALNVYESVKYLPKPNITVKDTFLMDNKNSAYPTNDGDAIIDAGETIDLGVLVRNRWGLTGEITVKADAVSVGGVANPYITFITDTVTLQPAGTYAEVNNGFVYDDGYLTAVSDPIRFTVAANTPNDTEICINLTATTTNGVDKNDSAEYTRISKYTFRVQAGRGIKGTISEDMTLTKDYLWIVENSVYIPEGVTLTVEPGTKIQFYSMDYENAYGGLTNPEINNDGNLIMNGTEDQPIELFPGEDFETMGVKIYGTGVETLRYCRIINPALGSKCEVDFVDHCELVQNAGWVGSAHTYRSSGGLSISKVFQLNVSKLTNTKIVNLGTIYYDASFGSAVYNPYEIHALEIDNCIFNQCAVDFERKLDRQYIYKNNVFMIADKGYNVCGRVDIESRLIRYNKIPNIIEEPFRGEYVPFTYDGAKSKYIYLKIPKYDSSSSYAENDGFVYPSGMYCYLFMKYAAEKLGGTLASINDETEKQFFISETTKGDYIIGGLYNVFTQTIDWADENTFLVDYTFVNESNQKFDGSSSFVKVGYYGLEGTSFIKRTKMMLEFPSEMTDDEIVERLDAFDFGKAFEEFCHVFNNTYNNAFINPILNTTPRSWTVYQAGEFDTEKVDIIFSHNYWGTENDTLINLMITDADDFAGTYQDVIHDPILTLESESISEIYPFVTEIYLTDKDGNTVTDV